MELPDCRVARSEHLLVAELVVVAHELRGLALRLGEHHVAPRPEVTAGRASPQRALERVAVRVHEARESERARHARDASRLGRRKGGSLTEGENPVTIPLLRTT